MYISIPINQIIRSIHWYALIHIQCPKIEIGCVLKIKNFFWHSIEDKYNHNAVWQG